MEQSRLQRMIRGVTGVFYLKLRFWMSYHLALRPYASSRDDRGREYFAFSWMLLSADRSVVRYNTFKEIMRWEVC